MKAFHIRNCFFRVMVDDDIPMSADCLGQIIIAVPLRLVLSAEYPTAVVAGNVEASRHRRIERLQGADSRKWPLAGGSVFRRFSARRRRLHLFRRSELL